MTFGVSSFPNCIELQVYSPNCSSRKDEGDPHENQQEKQPHRDLRSRGAFFWNFGLRGSRHESAAAKGDASRESDDQKF
jgi:hypothetical protein